MKKFRVVLQVIIDLAIPLAIGTLIATLTRDSIDAYTQLPKPPLSPPSWVFGVVWTILYLLMGISFVLVKRSDCKLEPSAFWIYAIQLGVNFIWPILFFNFNAYLLAFFWILLLVFLVARMVKLFYQCVPLAGLLQLPYLLWLVFAGYLNLAIYWLSR